MIFEPKRNLYFCQDFFSRQKEILKSAIGKLIVLENPKHVKISKEAILMSQTKYEENIILLSTIQLDCNLK